MARLKLHTHTHKQSVIEESRKIDIEREQGVNQKEKDMLELFKRVEFNSCFSVICLFSLLN